MIWGHVGIGVTSEVRNTRETSPFKMLRGKRDVERGAQVLSTPLIDTEEVVGESY